MANEDRLAQLAAKHPRLARQLLVAEQTRVNRTELLLDGARLHGLEELLAKLDEISASWKQDAQLRPIAFLVDRLGADFETALEANLSGYPSVVFDAMRDVMEIELLCLDFTLEPARITAWLTSDRKSRLREFSPGAVRQRVMNSGLHSISSGDHVDADYAAHSEGLHVSPVSWPVPFVSKGHVVEGDLVTLDAAFYEIFEHGRRIGNALLILSDRLSPDSPGAEACRGPLPLFEVALDRTKEYFGEFLRMVREQAGRS
jgi:hypothetical protein